MSTEQPPTLEPGREYLGFVCEHCHKQFHIVGPLDPGKVDRHKPMTIGSRGPLHAECPHCGQAGDYPIDQLKRFHT